MSEPSDDPLQELRRMAEARLAHYLSAALPALLPEEAQRLLLEQETYRLELEMQNEDLMAAHYSAEQARGEAEQARADYANLYEQAPVAYVTLTAAGLIEHVNQRACEVFKSTPDRLIGRRLLLFVAPEHRVAASEWLNRLKADAGVSSVELHMLTDTGTPWPAQLEGAASFNTPAHSWRLALFDMSEQARILAALRRSETRPQLALAASGAGVVEWDCATDLIFLDEQARSLVGLPGPAGELPVAALQEQVLPDDRTPLNSALNQAIAGQSVSFDFRVSAPDGQPRYLSVHCQVLFEQGRRLHLTGLVRDVTQQRQAQEQAAAQRLRQQQAVFGAVQATQEEERRRMAESLHNGVGQLLYLMKLRLEQEANKPTDAVRQLLEEAIRDVRAVSAELAPPVLDDFGLQVALESLARRVPKRQLRVNCNFQHLTPDLPRPLQTTVYRMVQELLNNVIKHAQAEEVFLHVVQEDGRLALSVDDDGQGFDVRVPTKVPPGIGLTSIRNQVALLGGTLRLVSEPGQGTSVSIELPTVPESPPAP